jgi:hypothetical protein
MAQARAYLARPEHGNLSLATMRLAGLQRRREQLIERLTQHELEAFEVL